MKSTFCALLTSFAILLATTAVAQEPSRKAASLGNADDAQHSQEPELFNVPDGSPEELQKFLNDLRVRRQEAQDRYNRITREAREEYQSFQSAASVAEASAAERILEIETDRSSDAYRLAVQILVPDRVRRIATSTPEHQAETLGMLKSVLTEKSKTSSLTRTDYSLVTTTARTLEKSGQIESAMDAYQSLGALLEEHGDSQTRRYAASLLASARRLGLLGSEMKLEGIHLDGTPFEIEELRGKTVLVDFWATWCGPCVSELRNNLKGCYEQYSNRDFEIVAISLDKDRRALESFLEEEQIPWIVLHDPEADGQHPFMKQYGINAIPAAFLLDPKGRVISLSARGSELRSMLQENLGSPFEIQGNLQCVDLQPQGNLGIKENFHRGGQGPNTLEELPDKEQVFAGVKFFVGEKLIHLGSKKVEKQPLSVEGISIGFKCTGLFFLHAAAFYDYSSQTNKPIGSYVVHYSDETSEEIPIVAGQEVLNFFRRPSSLTATRGVVAWEGENPMTRRGRWESYKIYLYVSRWENPHPDKAIKSMDFVSANDVAAPFCVAITAEKPLGDPAQ